MRGTVTKKNNRFYIVYYIGKDNGKWKQKWEGGFDTKKEAQKALRQRIDEVESSFVNSKDDSTMAVYLRYWLDSYCAPRLAANTLNGYRTNIEKHIIPLIGSIKLNRLQPLDVQTLYTKASEKGLSSTSVRYIHNTLHKALEQAVKLQMIARNAADFADAPIVAHYEAHTLTPEQARKLVSACEGSEIYIPVLLALMLGLRRGEALGLQWQDVDFSNRKLRICRSAGWLHGEFILSNTKTRNSRRTLLLSDMEVEALRQQRVTLSAWENEFGEGFNQLNLVNCRRDGSPLTTNALQRMFKNVLNENALPDIRFHDLRHTNATFMLCGEVPAKIVSSRLGHSTIGITLDTYSHVMTDMQSSAVGVIEGLLKGQY